MVRNQCQRLRLLLQRQWAALEALCTPITQHYAVTSGPVSAGTCPAVPKPTAGLIGRQCYNGWQQQTLAHPRSFAAASRDCTCRQYSGGSSSSSSSDSGDSNLQPLGRIRPRDMAIVFTCGQCDTRSMKLFSKQAYNAGVVLIKCPGCRKLHLIADSLGWFGDSGFKIGEYMAQQGQPVKHVKLDDSWQQASQTQQLTTEDMLGWSRVQQLLSTMSMADGSNTSCQAASSGGLSQQQARTSGSAGDTGRTGHASSVLAFNAQQQQQQDVFQVAPADVEAWKRVQQQQQSGPQGVQ